MSPAPDDAPGHGLRAGDAADARLLAAVRPPGWRSPAPADRYDVVAVGGGTAGLVTAMGAAGLGARVALVERALLGGDCLVTGCVPSKALLASAHAAAAVRDAAALGVDAGAPRVDFARVMARLRAARAELAPNDGAARLAGAGVDVFLGDARFVGPDALEVDGRRLRFKRAVVATGARPALPPIPGLAEVGALTSDTVFGLEALPRRLVVIGAGSIGCELGQAFARLGSEVTLVDVAPRVLPRDDADAAALVAASLARDGVTLRLGAEVRRCERGADGAVAVTVARDGADAVLQGDALLVAVGRRANVDALGLDAAGVVADARGIVVDARLRTANRRIYAAGDCVAGAPNLTHAADAMARMALRNALFFGRRRLDRLVLPHATYTAPEVARVGLGIEEVAALGDRLRAVTVPMARVDRAVCEGETAGFARFHVDRRGRIAAATLVGAHAGELVSEVAVAMALGAPLTALSDVVHPYPTRAEVVKRAADDQSRARLTPFVAWLLRRIIRWRR